MAMIIEGGSKCPLCGQVFGKGDDLVGFSAFLPPGHELVAFSDAAFHRACFDADPRAGAVNGLYPRYRRVWGERPRKLKTLSEVEDWQRRAFARLWEEDGFHVRRIAQPGHVDPE